MVIGYWLMVKVLIKHYALSIKHFLWLICPPYQSDLAPYQTNTHRYQAVSWRQETTLILTMQSYNIFRAIPNFGIP